jgi:hypothetical protein
MSIKTDVSQLSRSKLDKSNFLRFMEKMENENKERCFPECGEKHPPLFWMDECAPIDSNVWGKLSLKMPEPIEPLEREPDSNHYTLDDLLHGHNKICLETQNGVEIDIFVSAGRTYITLVEGKGIEVVGNISFIEPDEVE